MTAFDPSTASAEEGFDTSAQTKEGLAALTLGAVGVVYGDIGTSPIYAMRESLRVVAADGLERSQVIGVVSMLIWALVIIVTLKYVLVLLRADNHGEGGILALYTLVREAMGARSLWVLGLAIAGASLFFGDAIITPAISVLSAVEGTELITPSLSTYVLPITLAILVGLFLVQRHGTAAVSTAFGPITAVWFIVLAGLGLRAIAAEPTILVALDPRRAVLFLVHERALSFVVLGAIFLAVTGAEALYADLGHFGKAPIRIAWLALVFPALIANYLGQGALVMAHPQAVEDPFFLLVPHALLPWLVALATLATIIASQAVITGAYSMTRSAIQLGFLPRLTIRHTSEAQSGQIYIGVLNWLLFVGVVMLVLSFRSSSALASAYGIAVTGTMIVTTVLTIVLARRSWGRPHWQIVLLASPLVLLELAFLASNLLKLPDGGYVPVTLAVILALLMAAWWRGVQRVKRREGQAKVDLESFAHSIAEDPRVERISGTAFFLTSDASAVPLALLHNLKHNHVLHEQNVLITIETMRIPQVRSEDRVEFLPIDENFSRLKVRFGFMETPNLSRAISLARRSGLRFDVMSSTFFLGRRKVVASKGGIERVFDRLFIGMGKFAADPSDYYHLPRDRVVELGTRISL
ncbi:MAG: potassium transporter Kup [Paracoccaceae bacterium]|nr:potassium transporter Kup [Paracoccaceae bacterium]